MIENLLRVFCPGQQGPWIRVSKGKNFVLHDKDVLQEYKA